MFVTGHVIRIGTMGICLTNTQFDANSGMSRRFRRPGADRCRRASAARASPGPAIAFRFIPTFVWNARQSDAASIVFLDERQPVLPGRPTCRLQALEHGLILQHFPRLQLFD